MTIRFQYGGPTSQSFAGDGNVRMYVTKEAYGGRQPAVMLTYTTGEGTMRKTDQYITIHPEDFNEIAKHMVQADRAAALAAFKVAKSQK